MAMYGGAWRGEKRGSLARRCGWLMALALTAGLLVPAAWPADGKKGDGKKPEQKQETKKHNKPKGDFQPRSSDISDENVVASMRKGIEYLLKSRKGDNWEEGTKWPKEGQTGGVTAIAVYALLHAGQSLEDERLTFRSPEMAPSINWLCKADITETYSAALASAALGLVPIKKPEIQGRLEYLRMYLTAAMAPDGGYTYGPNEMGKQEKGKTSLRSHIEDAIALGKLYQQLAEARGRNDDAAVKSLTAVIRRAETDYIKLTAELDKAWNGDVVKNLMEARKHFAEASQALRTGGFKEVPATDAKGNPLKDAKGKDLKKRVPKTREELEKDFTDAKANLAEAEKSGGASFKPFGDLSNGQYGTLGVWSLADAGLEIPTTYWVVADKFWRLTQQPSGSWPYNADKGGERATMGLAGIASLFITQEFLDTEIRLEPKPDKNIADGLAWLNADFRPDGRDLYYMYGVERIGLASGLKFFNKTNWYKEGAKAIMAAQGGDGSWQYHGSNTVGTAYALLFLARGRNPVAFNKLEHEGPWNARPRDNANLTQRMSKQLEKPINWQSVNFKVDVEEWQDAPILLITSSRDPKFTKDDIAKLRAFVNAGGLIFSTADGNSPAFTEYVRKLANELYDGRYEMRELPKEHYIFNIWSPVAAPPRMLGLSNGIRDVWIHSTVDMGASWQGRKLANKECFEIPINTYFYTTGKGSLRTKLQPLAVNTAGATTTRTISLARVEYPGNWDPEPGAWARMSKLAKVNFHTDLQVTSAALANLDATKTPVAHMTGTTRFAVSPEMAEGLAKFVKDGGTLIADAGGGSPDFTASFMELCKAAFPDKTPVPVANGDPLIAGGFEDAVPLGNVEYRKFAILKLNRANGPRLLAVDADKRHAVIFAPEDFMSGFLGTNTWGILGWDPPSAQAIARNLLLYAAKNAPAAAAATSAPAPAPAVAEQPAPKKKKK